MSRLPRTLIVSEAPVGFGDGFGVTLSTFFDGWPAECLRVFHTRPSTATAHGLRERTTFADVPGHWGRRYALECLFARRPAWRGRYSAAWLRRALKGWRPEVVYAFVFSRDTLAFATWIAERLRCRLVAHVADDGLETPNAGGSRDSRSLLRGAARCLTISEEMREEFRTRYGVESDVLHNGAAEALFENGSAPVDNSSFIVRYLGSVVPVIHFNAIEDIGAAIRRLVASGIDARFELFGGAWSRADAERLTGGGEVVYGGAVGRDEGVDLLHTADLLVIPVGFDPALFLQRRLSLPTKLTEYLASGTPTLVYGPRGSAPVEFCRRHGVGTVLDERSPEKLETLLRGLAAGRAEARESAERDREFIHQRYSAALVRERFRAIIDGVAR